MRIVFLCSSLEPGRDGVGDYTRRLAAECIRQGNECRLISLNERNQVSDQRSVGNPLSAFSISAFHSFQESEGTKVQCLRLPGTLKWSERTVMARQWVDLFKPDWVSLQFVPFGFHPKGLCFGIGTRLATINSRVSWHIMFHELWLGLEKRASVKYRCWGTLQRFIIKDLVERLHPRVVHTQAEPYRQVLARVGIQATLLPLFSNISVTTGEAWGDLIAPLLQKSVVSGRWAADQQPLRRGGGSLERSQYYLAGVFGAVHPEWDPATAVNTILQLTQKQNKWLVLVFFGKSHLDELAGEKLKEQLHGRAEVMLLGSRSDAGVSKILNTLDLGLATSPRQLIQKSGSVAAMLEHGLSVLVVRDDWQLRVNPVQPESGASRLFSTSQFALLKTLPMRNFISPVKREANTIASRLLSEMETPLSSAT